MINVAIIGAGAISDSHIEAYLAFPGRCRIAAISEKDTAKAEEKVGQYSLDATVFDDYRSMLQSENIDLVSICTPPGTHSKIAVDCLNAGVNVMLEKPMAASLEECDKIIEAAEKNGKLVSVVAQTRFKNTASRLKKVLESGLIGKLNHVQVDSYWWRGASYYDLFWRGKWETEGGGCTLNHAVHHIDLLLWMTGMPSEVCAMIANTAHSNSEMEDISIAVLKYGQSMLGEITSSIVHHGEEQQMVFQGEYGRVSAPWKTYSSLPQENGFPLRSFDREARIQDYFESIPKLAYEGHIGQIDNVLTAVETGGKPLIDGTDGRNTLELIMAIYKSACTGTFVKLPISSDDPFYTREGTVKNAIYFNKKIRNIEKFSNNTITVGSTAFD